MNHARDRKSPGPPISGEGGFVERFERLAMQVVEFQGLLDQTQEALIRLDDELQELRLSVLASQQEQVSGERRIPKEAPAEERHDSIIPDWLEREFEDACPEDDEGGDMVASPSPTGGVSGVRFVRESEELEFELSSLLDNADTDARGAIEGESWDLDDEGPARSVSRITRTKIPLPEDPEPGLDEEPEEEAGDDGWRVSTRPPRPEEQEEPKKGRSRITAREVKRPSQERVRLPRDGDDAPRGRRKAKSSPGPRDRDARRRRQQRRTSSRRDRLETGRGSRAEPKQQKGELDSLLSEFLDD